MDQEFPLGVRLAFAGGAVMCFVWAYLIGVKQKVSLIAGYDASKVADQKGLCRWIAFWLVLAGICGAAYPWIFGPSKPPGPPWGLFAVFVVFAAIMWLGAQRCKKGG